MLYLKTFRMRSTGWALFGVKFRPSQKIEAIMGGGRILDTGPFFTRLRYIHQTFLLQCVHRSEWGSGNKTTSPSPFSHKWQKAGHGRVSYRILSGGGGKQDGSGMIVACKVCAYLLGGSGGMPPPGKFEFTSSGTKFQTTLWWHLLTFSNIK